MDKFEAFQLTVMSIFFISCVIFFVIFCLKKQNRHKGTTADNDFSKSEENASVTVEPDSLATPISLDEILVEQSESEIDILPPTEKYNTSEFNILLDKAITAVLFNNDASPSVISAVINGGYHQAAKLLEHMEYLGIIGPLNPPMPREIFLHPVLYREFIGKKLLSYPPELGVSEVIKLLAGEVASLLSRIFHEIDIVDLMEGSEFEDWCAVLLKDLEYKEVEVTPRSGDQGVDITARLEDARFAFQCKCYSSDIGNTSVQEVYAGKCFYECHVGIVVTNRCYTSGAAELAKSTNTVLWDRNRLQELIERTKDKRTRRNHYKNIAETCQIRFAETDRKAFAVC